MSGIASLFQPQPPFTGAYNATSLGLGLQLRGILVEEHQEGQILEHKEYQTELSYIAYHGNCMCKSSCHLRKTLTFNSESH